MLRKRRIHIHRILSILLLLVFAIALTPFNAFHNHRHEEVKCVGQDKTCTHQIHVGNPTEECLICAVHFEKNYTTTQQYFQIFLENKSLPRYCATINGFYTELINQSLRGPPLA